jgi:predicted MPP superfamily phosphohydrolase
MRTAGGALVGATALGLYTWRVEPHWVKVVECNLPTPRLPDSWVGRRIVQISDLHVGPIVDNDFLTAALESIADLKPDATVITGDFMHCHGDEQVDATARVLEHLKPGALGCFAVLGNHDYAVRWQQPEVGAKLAGRLTDLGIHLLQNEVQIVDGLQLVGIDDFWGPNFRPDLALGRADWNQPALTLCHNPDAVDLPALKACRGWILAGHTHGGQCKPPFLPPPMLPVKNRRYTQGEFDLGDGRWLYINPGLGYLKRVRFNVRPEITVFTMTQA